MEINEINHVLVEWKIEKEIGQGSFGKVYLAKRKIFTQEYYAAIKVITIPQSEAQIAEELASGQTINSVREYFRGVVEDWHSEIKMLERLKGVTNIVGVEDYQIIENEDKLHWDIIIRMEYLTPFNKYIMDHLIDTKDALKLGVDICRALKYCEHQRILHRDIKPENIFISKFGDYKLGDFGIARQLEKTTSNLSRKGTYLYMAPEVYRGEEYDHTVDIYSLGIVMYRLFNQNKLPFIPLEGGVMRASDKENSIIQRIRGTELPNPVNANQEIARIIKKACAPNPLDRYQSASEMLDELQKSLDKVDVASNRVLVNIPELNVNEVSAVTNGNGNVTSSDSSDSTDKTKGLDLGTSEDKPKDKVIIPVLTGENIALDDFKGTGFVEKLDTTDNTTGIDTTSRPKIVVKQESVEEQQKEVDSNEDKGNQVVSTEVKEEVAASSVIPASTTFQNHEEKKQKRNKLVYLFAFAAVLIIGLSIWYFGFGANQAKTVNVPSVVAMLRDQAIEKLEDTGLKVKVEFVVDDGQTEGAVIAQSEPADTTLNKGTEVTITVVAHTAKVTVPELVGLTLEEATAKLDALKLGYETTTLVDDSKEVGRVAAQSLVSSTTVNTGTKVTLTIVAHSAKVTVPNLVGLSLEKAKTTLSNLGLTFEIKSVTDDNKTANQVFQQSVAKDSSIKVGSNITISVYVKSGNVLIPTAIGVSATSFQTSLTNLGLKYSTTQKYSDTVANGTIISISPAAGAKVAKGTVISIVISKGASTFGDWVTVLPANVSDTTHYIESKKQYQYRDKEFTTNASATLSGWIKYNETVTYSNWSSWSTTVVTATATREVGTNVVPEISSYDMTTNIYRCYVNSVITWCFTAVPTPSMRDVGWYKENYMRYGVLPYNLSPFMDGYIIAGDQGEPSYYANARWFIKTTNYTNVTYYRYRDKTTTYHFYRWGDWKAWQDTAVTATENREVTIRTVYRYREK